MAASGLTTRDWSAWIDVMPGQDNETTVHVAGTCIFPTTGYSAELRYVEPQGITHENLLLKLDVTAPEIGEETITEQEVGFSRPAKPHEYRLASVVGVEENIPVRQTS